MINMRPRHYWSEGEKKWLVEQDATLSYKQLTELYNNTYGNDLSVGQVADMAHKLNARRITNKHRYTEEQKAWLLNQDHSLTYEELTNLFNRKFGLSLSASRIQDLLVKRLNAKRSGNKGQFKTGAKPKYSIGDEIIKDGYIYVKIADQYKPGKYTAEDYKRNWKRKANIVWEKERGEIPQNHFLIFLDGNPLNCDISNLYPVTRAVHGVMASNKWYKLNREFTLGALKYCELLQAKREAMA